MSATPTLSRPLIEALRTSNVSVDVPPKSVLDLPEKIVQFGTGAFLRGFVESIIDGANRRGAFDGRIVAIASTSSGGGRHHAFVDQDGLFTLVTRSATTDTKPRVISAISRVIAAS